MIRTPYTGEWVAYRAHPAHMGRVVNPRIMGGRVWVEWERVVECENDPQEVVGKQEIKAAKLERAA